MPNKTTENNNSVADYLAGIPDAKKRADTSAVIKLIEKATSLKPKMWGTAIVGFGSYHYVYESGREGDAPLTGVSARSNAITFYMHFGDENNKNIALLEKLGKHKTGKGCLYIQKLEDVDKKVLAEIAVNTVEQMRKKYPGNK